MPNMLKKSKLGFWPNPTCGHIVQCREAAKNQVFCLENILTTHLFSAFLTWKRYFNQNHDKICEKVKVLLFCCVSLHNYLFLEKKWPLIKSHWRNFSMHDPSEQVNSSLPQSLKVIHSHFTLWNKSYNNKKIQPNLIPSKFIPIGWVDLNSKKDLQFVIGLGR